MSKFTTKWRGVLTAFFFAVVFSANAQNEDDGSASFSDFSEEELYDLSLEDLLNLEVTVASKSAERLSDAAGVVSVITQDDLKRFGGLTLRDVLERVPSLIGASSFFTDRYMLASRGDQVKINSGHILLLINGRPTREIVEGGVSSEMYAAFPVNIIERIEVIKGPGSVLYGSNAFSAVINVITKEAEENNVAVTGIAGESGAKGISGEVFLNSGELAITAAGRYMKKADYKTDYQSFNAFFSTVPIDTTVTIPDESHGAYFSANYKNLSLTSSFNQFRTTYFSQGFVDQTKWQKSFNNLGYEVAVSEKWDMDVNVTYNYATLKSGLFPGIKRKSNDLVTELTNRINLGKKSNLVIGGLYNYIKGQEKAPIYIPNGDTFIVQDAVVSDETRGSFALYSQVNFWALENLKLIGGFQANKVEDIKLNVVPRAGFIWYPVARLNIKGLYGQAFRAASVDEFGLSYQGFSGNPDIKPEKVSTMDIGVNYLGEKIQGGVNYFRNTQTNIIAPGFVDTLYMYVNKGEINFQGLEFEAKYYFNKSLYFTGSMLYQESEDEDGNKNVTPIANFGAKAGISYVWDKGITASLFDIYQGKLDEKYTNPTYNVKPGSYNILNLYLNFDVVKLFNLGVDQGISLFVQGNNMLNQEIWTPDWGGFEGESIPVNQGRAVYLGLKMSLK